MLRFSISLLVSLIFISPCYAGHSDMTINTTLARIVNQLDAILPLIDQGKYEQTQLPQQSIRFHFEGFTTYDKQYHHGLKEDVLAMRQAILNAIHQSPVTASMIKPLSLDYIDDPVKVPHRVEYEQVISHVS